MLRCLFRRLVDERNQGIRHLAGVFLMVVRVSLEEKDWCLQTHSPLALVLVRHVSRKLGDRVTSEEGDLEETVDDGVDP
jgi:hypothetical protein